MEPHAEDQRPRAAVPGGDQPGRLRELQELDPKAEQICGQCGAEGGQAREEETDQPERHCRVQHVAGVLRQPGRQQVGKLARRKAEKDGEDDKEGVGEAASRF